MPKKRRRILRAIKIDEISGVDNPAQVGARVAILKRAAPDGNRAVPARKGMGDLVDVLTSIDLEHQHGISVEQYDERIRYRVTWAQAPDMESGHDHPLARTPDGYVLGVVDGHTHTVDSELLAQGLMNAMNAMNKGDPLMGDKDTDTDKTTANSLQAEHDRLTAIVGLGATDRAHFEGLGETAVQDAFLAQPPDIRTEEIAAALQAQTDADPVIYKTTDGMELRKSAGEVTISLARRLDASEKRSAELEARDEQARLEKRADTELPNLVGDVKTRAALLKAAEGIPDATQRDAAVESLRTYNEAMVMAFQRLGTTEASEAGSPLAKLDKMAEQYASEHDVTFEAAYDKVVMTPKGRPLYDQANN